MRRSKKLAVGVVDLVTHITFQRILFGLLPIIFDIPLVLNLYSVNGPWWKIDSCRLNGCRNFYSLWCGSRCFRVIVTDMRAANGVTICSVVIVPSRRPCGALAAELETMQMYLL